MTAVDANLTATVHGMVPFARALDIEFLSGDPQEVRTRLTRTPERCTSGGVLHGGAVTALADTVGATCAYINLPEGASGTTTVE